MPYRPSEKLVSGPWYCPVLECGIRNYGVCKRRSEEVLEKIYPECTSCSYKSVLVSKVDIPKKVKIVMYYSEPPNNWWNVPKYRDILGEDVCKKVAIQNSGFVVRVC